MPPVADAPRRSDNAGSNPISDPIIRCVVEILFLPKKNTTEPARGYIASRDIIVESKSPGITKARVMVNGRKNSRNPANYNSLQPAGSVGSSLRIP